MKTNYIEKAVKSAGGISAVARACGVDPRAVRRWVDLGRLPNTAFSGETDYIAVIHGMVKGQVTKAQLKSLEYWSETYPEKVGKKVKAA